MGTSDAEWPKMGRPPKKIDWVQFEVKCAKQCTLTEIALFFRVDPKTLQDKIKTKYGQTFSQVFSIFRMAGVDSLRSRQYDIAMGVKTALGDRDMIKFLDKKYAHLQGDVDPRFYGPTPEELKQQDKKIDVTVQFVDPPANCAEEVHNTEKLTGEE